MSKGLLRAPLGVIMLLDFQFGTGPVLNVRGKCPKRGEYGDFHFWTRYIGKPEEDSAYCSHCGAEVVLRIEAHLEAVHTREE